MANLPSKRPASKPSSPARQKHREWIGGRAITLLSHYYRPDDPVQLTAAIGRDWADVLEPLPQDLLQRACVQYLKDEAKKRPTPGAIYRLANAIRAKDSMLARPALEKSLEIPLQTREPATREQVRKALRAVGYKVNKFGKVVR